MTRIARASIVLTVLLLAAPAVSGADAEYLLAGGDQAIWIVRSRAGDEEPVFDLVARQCGKKWKWVAAGQRGRPAHTVAADGRSAIQELES